MRTAQEKYFPWDVFRYLKFPEGIGPEQAWAYLKLTKRGSLERTPIKAVAKTRSKKGDYFGFASLKTLYHRLSVIDTHAAGLIQTLAAKPTENQKERLIVSGLSEEAIASSQIEGANTSRKAAKEMIYSGRKPRTKSEQMIVNNYQVMKMLDGIKDLELNEKILLEIQGQITKETLEDPSDGGRFRVDSDEIVVNNKLTGETVFVPPDEAEMRKELGRFLNFANRDEEGEEAFIHPVIKATILHFWLAYLHPFVDGNGRTARAIFYWYLIKKGYWLFQYLSISRIIKTSKKRYDDAFLHSELDESDLTYFLLYVTEITCRAIKDAMQHYEKKVREAEEYKRIVEASPLINSRQAALLAELVRNPLEVTDIKTYQTKNAVVYETARRDLLELASQGLIGETKKGKKKLYLANVGAIKKFLKEELPL